MSHAASRIWWRIAWRNMWRNKRRTLLTASALAFGFVASVLMIGYMHGMLEEMISNGTGVATGQVRIHAEDYEPERSIHDTMGGREGLDVDAQEGNLRLDLGGTADLTVGRQPVSWATTLVLTSADPFSPFDPADPFREYRIGVDAERLRYYRGAFTQFEVVARPARIAKRGTLTLLGRASTNAAGWDVGGWAGMVHDTFGAAAFLSGAVGLWALRAEAAVRDLDGRTSLRAAIGLDRTVPIAERDLYIVIGYQHDGLGATSPDELLPAATSRAFAQSEMQVVGRDTGALQLSYPLHPLVSASALWLGSLRDGSFLVSPGLGYSATESPAGSFFRPRRRARGRRSRVDAHIRVRRPAARAVRVGELVLLGRTVPGGHIEPTETPQFHLTVHQALHLLQGFLIPGAVVLRRGVKTVCARDFTHTARMEVDLVPGTPGVRRITGIPQEMHRVLSPGVHAVLLRPDRRPQ